MLNINWEVFNVVYIDEIVLLNPSHTDSGPVEASFLHWSWFYWSLKAGIETLEFVPFLKSAALIRLSGFPDLPAPEESLSLHSGFKNGN